MKKTFTKEQRKNFLEGKKEERNELENKLVDGVEKMLDSDVYKEYLKFASKVPTRSIQNQILVWCQNKDATLCLGANQWRERFDRYVNKGEKAIKIFAPMVKTFNSIDDLNSWSQSFRLDAMTRAGIERDIDTKGFSQIITGFKTVNVFDVSQTNGKPLPQVEICQLLEGDVKNYNTVIRTLCEVASIPCVFHKEEEDAVLQRGARGYYSHALDKIVIRHGMSQIQTVSTLVHEIAHSILHSESMKIEGIWDSTACKDIKEFEAESVSYMVCQRLGIETETKTFGYIASWIGCEDKEKTIQKMKDNLSVVCKCADKIIENLEKAFEKEMPKEEVKDVEEDFDYMESEEKA